MTACHVAASDMSDMTGGRYEDSVRGCSVSGTRLQLSGAPRGCHVVTCGCHVADTQLTRVRWAPLLPRGNGCPMRTCHVAALTTDCAELYEVAGQSGPATWTKRPEWQLSMRVIRCFQKANDWQ
ncbi:hypothetical protein Tco_0802762 [Tanacetum coccineum]|uniref:Uncharacterized protein n=1 Tax=Tanacetum coccineum TaxID=301880 RepID=A0ABQ4ZZQ4_9ASTR